MQFLITALLVAAWLLWLWAATRSPENTMLGETLRDIFHFLKEWRHETNQNERIIVTALENLTAAVGTLTTSVTALTTEIDDAVTHIGTPGATDAQLNTLAGTVASLASTVDAQSKRLADAVAVPVPPPTPTPAPTP